MGAYSMFRLVSEATLEQVHDSTLKVLEETGIVFKSEECLDVFKKHGAKVEGQTAYLPKAMVNKAIETTPSSFSWEARNPEHSIVVDSLQKNIHVCLNNGPIYIQDLDNGRRLGSAEDLVNLYKLAHQSSVCSIVGQIPVEPADITGPTHHMEVMRLLLNHSDKPMYGWVGEQHELEQMFNLIRIAHGSELGDDSIFDKHRIAVSLNPLSPLSLDKIPCQTLLTYARLRQPVMVLTCAMAGVTSPVDPMGTVVVQNAEMLAGLTLAQLVSEGTPVIYSPASAIPNMRTASYIAGSPVSNLMNIVCIQLCRELYKVPCRGMAGLTDAKEVDCQAGYETMQNYLMLAMAGVNMVNECYGILDAIMTVSYEKFIIDDEIMSRAGRVVEGIESFSDDFSVDLIQKVGHGGSYLMDPSTLKHCRGFWTPTLSTMDSFKDWQKKGGEDVVVKANKKYKEILAHCPERVLAEDIDNDLVEYISAIESDMK